MRGYQEIESLYKILVGISLVSAVSSWIFAFSDTSLFVIIDRKNNAE